MSTVRAEIDIDLPISTVYNQWTQFETFPQFMSGVDVVRQVDDTHTHWEVSLAGVSREFDAEIVEQTPDERIAWNSTAGEEHAGVVTFHRLSDDTTKVTLQLTWEPKGAVERIGSLLQIDDIQIDRDLRSFKDLIEHNGFESGSWRGDVDRAPDATGR
ncbi:MULTISPECIES: SRPBCC family protein [Microcella]|jgi:uncharacterized membrane protein|uniref:SRPBCC family protein n=1 Tax=Microcella TaxID=337004 RepID=UPI0015CF6A2A|nr:MULTISPECIES: SRPBCC family protein [Microcella]QOD94048.1 SRPBCC family protein [Chryseoglobus sp. 28M-23]